MSVYISRVGKKENSISIEFCETRADLSQNSTIIIIFFSWSSGLRSYGKVVYVFTLVPVFGTLVLCTKLLGLTPLDTMQFFPTTVWSDFFVNGKSWVAASNEVFLTWGLLGAAAMQVSPIIA